MATREDFCDSLTGLQAKHNNKQTRVVDHVKIKGQNGDRM